MTRRTRASDALKARALALRAEGKNYVQIASALGISVTHARRCCGSIILNFKKPMIEGGTGHVASHRANIDAARLKRLIPPDTRDLTSYLCGDPLPGRSALDRSAS